MRRPRRTEAVLALALLAGACAGAFRPPQPGAMAALQAAPTYSAAVRVSVGGALLRGRAGAIVAFRRPDALRVEVAGPGGAQLIAVARDGQLTAVFPADRAVFRAAADADAFGDLLGIPLAPADVIDFLSGVAPARVRDYRADWGPVAPRRVHGRIPDGPRLRLTVEEPELGAVPDAAFDPPPHEGWREVSAEEAQKLWAR